MTDINEEMAVALHMGASAVRNLLAVLLGDDLGAKHFTSDELREIAINIAEAFLECYDRLDATGKIE